MDEKIMQGLWLKTSAASKQAFTSMINYVEASTNLIGALQEEIVELKKQQVNQPQEGGNNAPDKGE